MPQQQHLPYVLTQVFNVVEMIEECIKSLRDNTRAIFACFFIMNEPYVE